MRFYASIRVFRLFSSFVVEGYRYLNGDAKALADSSLYVGVKLYALVGRNRVR